MIKLPNRLQKLTQLHSDIVKNVTPKERRVMRSAMPMSDVFSRNMGEDLYKKGSGAFCLECGKEMQKYKGEDSRFYCKHCNKSYFGEDVF